MNWSRRELKTQAKRSLRASYAKMLIVCLILLFVAGEFSDTKSMFSRNDVTEQAVSEETVGAGILEKKDNSDIVGETLEGLNQSVDKIKEYHPTRGVLAGLFNSITASGSVIFGVLNALNSMVFEQRIASGILMLSGVLITILFLLFVQEILMVGGRRFFLEARKYKKSRVERMLLPYHVKRTVRVAGAVLKTSIYKWLWTLTVIGGVIKTFSYYLVPFILAENPNITGSEAITLSRHMMKGHKWRTFVLWVSFFGWEILNGLTLGLLGVFFLNPYRMSVDTELYMELRKQAKAARLPGSELLNDRMLDGEPVDAEYPAAQFTLSMHESRKWMHIDYRRDYSLLHLILMFFIFAFIGWCWEVSLHLFQDGVFVNRGVLFGPWLPIYGSGGVLILVLLKPFRDNHWLTFLLAVILCGIVEYSTSVWLEFTHNGTKWWDYSGYFLNINGRVCLEGLLTFGAGGCLFIYIAGPLLDNLLKRLPNRIGWVIAVILLCLFAADNVYSKFHPNTGKGITDYESKIVVEQWDYPLEL